MENEGKLPRDDIFDVHSHPTINECPRSTLATTDTRLDTRDIYSGDILLLLDHVLASFQRDNVFAMCRYIYIIYIHIVCFVASYGKIVFFSYFYKLRRRLYVA